jgi:malonyl-CoA O-methyltransferase
MDSLRSRQTDPDLPLRDESASTPDKHWVGRSFGAAAPGYDGVAVLQQEVGQHLLRRLCATSPSADAVLDLGAGTGYFTERLCTSFKEAQYLALDLAEGMLRHLREKRRCPREAGLVVGDAECLPFAAGTFDVIFANMVFQWCGSLPAAFAECARVLRPGGVLAFSMFGEGSLCELSEAWSRIDRYSHVNTFPTRVSVAAGLHASGFSLSEVKVVRQRRCYPSLLALMRELKALGAHNVTRDRPRHLLGRGTLERLAQVYQKRADGSSIQATFEILSAVVRK